MFEQVPNPDNVPGEVSSGYQRQNTNLFIIQTGLDTTEPWDKGSEIIIPAGGVVEFNGVMFKLPYDITITKPVPSMMYWIAIGYDELNSSTVIASPVTRPGKWNPAKQGCYLPDGRRTLNWVSLGEISYEGMGGLEYQSPAIKGSYNLQLTTGWKYVELASGKSGNGGDASATGAKGLGGNPTIANVLKKVYFNTREELIISIGADGDKGGNGGDGIAVYLGGHGGGGGAAGLGERSTINSKNLNIDTGDKIGKGGLGYGNGGNGGDSGQPGERGVGHWQGEEGSPGGIYPGGNGINGFEIGGGGPGGGDWSGFVGAGGGASGLNGNKKPAGSPGGYANIWSIEI